MKDTKTEPPPAVPPPSSGSAGMSLGEAAKRASQEWEPFGQNHDPDLRRIQREAYASGFMRGFNACADRSVKITPPEPPRHKYKPNRKHPWFCSECGYAEHDEVKHLPNTD